jgi:hypothetical protein
LIFIAAHLHCIFYLKVKFKDFVKFSDIKYLIHECRVSQNDGAGAIAALETVPAKARNPRINMALGKLYSARGLERSAITAYKEVLRVGIQFFFLQIEILLKL